MHFVEDKSFEWYDQSLSDSYIHYLIGHIYIATQVKDYSVLLDSRYSYSNILNLIKHNTYSPSSSYIAM